MCLRNIFSFKDNQRKSINESSAEGTSPLQKLNYELVGRKALIKFQEPLPKQNGKFTQYWEIVVTLTLPDVACQIYQNIVL